MRGETPPAPKGCRIGAKWRCAACAFVRSPALRPTNRVRPNQLDARLLRSLRFWTTVLPLVSDPRIGSLAHLSGRSIPFPTGRLHMISAFLTLSILGLSVFVLRSQSRNPERAPAISHRFACAPPVPRSSGAGFANRPDLQTARERYTWRRRAGFSPSPVQARTPRRLPGRADRAPARP